MINNKLQNLAELTIEKVLMILEKAIFSKLELSIGDRSINNKLAELQTIEQMDLAILVAWRVIIVVLRKITMLDKVVKVQMEVKIQGKLD